MAVNLKEQLQRLSMGACIQMRNEKDRRKPADPSAIILEDLHAGATDRRKRADRRLENLDAEERQLLLSEMPGHDTSGHKD